MQIRPVPFTADSQGLPAKSFAYHVGLSFENPVNSDNKITVTDGKDGPQTSNPFYVDAYGHWINNNGQPINPWIDSESYSLTVLAPSGAELIAITNIVSDNVAPSDISANIVDAVINNLDDPATGAKVLDLSEYETIYVESIAAGWEDTVPGPIGGFYAHRDGTNGPASTGDQDQFYDASGTGFTRDEEQRINPSDGLTYDSSDNTAAVNVDNTTIQINGSNQLTAITDIAVGVVSMYAGSSAPSLWLEMDGTAVDRTTYADLFAAIGTNYGNGDGATTFNLPDARGLFPRFWDNGAGNDPDSGGRTANNAGGNTGDSVGSEQPDAFGEHNHPVSDSSSSPGAFNNSFVDGSGSGSALYNTDDVGGNETRPKNLYFMGIIYTGV